MQRRLMSSKSGKWTRCLLLLDAATGVAPSGSPPGFSADITSGIAGGITGGIAGGIAGGTSEVVAAADEGIKASCDVVDTKSCDVAVFSSGVTADSDAPARDADDATFGDVAAF